MGSKNSKQESEKLSKFINISASYSEIDEESGEDKLNIVIEKSEELNGTLCYDTLTNVTSMLLYLLYMDFLKEELEKLKSKMEDKEEDDLEIEELSDVECSGHRSLFLAKLFHDITVNFNNIIDESFYSEEGTLEKLEDKHNQSVSIFDSFATGKFENNKDN